MVTRSIETEQARSMLVKFIEQHKLPFVAEVTSGRSRSKAQNRMQHEWFKNIADQLGETPEYWRGYAKLHMGVPIRRETSEAFRQAYDQDLKPLPYEMKLKLMTVPFDMPVTRDFKVAEMKRYLDDVFRHFSQLGVILTDPDSLKDQALDAELVERFGS